MFNKLDEKNQTKNEITLGNHYSFCNVRHKELIVGIVVDKNENGFFIRCYLNGDVRMFILYDHVQYISSTFVTLRVLPPRLEMREICQEIKLVSGDKFINFSKEEKERFIKSVIYLMDYRSFMGLESIIDSIYTERFKYDIGVEMSI